MSTPSQLVLHERYRIDARLGQSRLAAVYRAYDLRLQRPVLVHLLREELLGQPALSQRFLDEARRGAQRSHPGLLEVYDSGEISGRPYMVTEDLAGQPLIERIPLPVADALSVLRNVTSAVALAQSQGAPHPPISSRNVWLLEGGRAVLLENWLLSPQEAALDLAHYRAPERARGGPPSPATSVYALGILSWETIAGRRPFTGASPEAIAQQQLRDSLPALSDVNPRLFVPGLDRVLAGAAAAEPDERYPAPVDFSRALDLYVDQATAHTGRLAILPKPQLAAAAVASRVFRRRDQTTATMVAPPPPPQELRGQIPAPRRAFMRPAVRPAPPPPTPQPAPAPPQELGQVVQQAVRKEMRRQSCQRAIVKRSIQLALIVAVVYGLLVGVTYAMGRVQQVDPFGWVTGQLPALPSLPNIDLSWLDRLRRLVGGGSSTVVVVQSVNMRTGPGTNNPLVGVLPEGTVLKQIGGPVDDPNGAPFQWIKVATAEGGKEGWIANQADRLRAQ